MALREFFHVGYNKEEELRNFFITQGRPFRVKRTAYSTMFENNKRKVILSKMRLWGKHLGLITELKHTVRRTVKNVQKVPPDRVYDYNEEKFQKTDGRLLNLSEFDLTAAYVSAGRKLEYIPEPLAEKILKTKKQFRLKILGSLGTRKTVQEYDENGKFVLSRIEQDEFLRSVWHSIVGTVNQDLREQCKADSRWVAYWVDNYWTHAVDTGLILFDKQGYRFRCNETDLVYRKTANRISMFFPDERFISMPIKFNELTGKVGYDNFIHNPEPPPESYYHREHGII